MRFAGKFIIVLLVAIVAALSSCSVGNKDIPDPNGTGTVDTTGTIGSFYLNVTGDTTYLLNILAVDTVVLDSFVLAGADATTRDQIVFATNSINPGIYYTEQAPPQLTTAYFIFRRRVPTGYRNYLMIHGSITITSFDVSTGVIRGKIDVNNQYLPNVDKTLFLKGNFVMKLNP